MMSKHPVLWTALIVYLVMSFVPQLGVASLMGKKKGK